MEYSKRNGNILIQKLNQRELFSLLKTQIACSLVFEINEEKTCSDIELGERILKGHKQCINIVIDGVMSIMEYNELISLIQENIKLGILSVEIEQKLFIAKQSIIAIFEDIKKSIVDSCVYMDYNDDVFEIINKPFPGNITDKLYFFENNNSILLFSKDGPRYITNKKINSIEDLICGA